MAAYGARDDEQYDGHAPEKRVQECSAVPVRIEVLAERAQRGDGGEGNREEQHGPGQTVSTLPVGDRGEKHEDGRKRSAYHEHVASRPGRTILPGPS